MNMKSINLFFLQWFFVRLTRCEVRVIDDIQLFEVSLLPSGGLGFGSNVRSSHIEYWYTIQGWIIPGTGWDSRFRYVKRNWHIKITKPKKVS